MRTVLLPFALFFFGINPVAFAGINGEQVKPAGINQYLSRTVSSSDISITKYQLLTEAGKTVGFRGGKAERSFEIQDVLERKSPTLDRLYDFRILISNQGWLPPVIDEAIDVAHISSDQIRTANKVYEILQPARFVSNPPSWRRWLLIGLSSIPEIGPESDVLTENSEQKRVWKNAVRQGWLEGRESADFILEANFNRLTRDYKGMLIYSQLLRQGFITAPIVSDQQQTVSGDKQKLTTGERLRKLKQPAEFVTDKTKWRPVILSEK
ncbi:type IV secretion system DotC family protein [Morganella psychrotolerans]|uniref:type IV secretion system DotC family protein n=1 Tax=Morganella psychrotolerans TaxID=368603 RepID=UPI0039B0B93D